MTDYPCRYCQKRHPGSRAGGQAQHGTDLHSGAEGAAETSEKQRRGDMTDKRYPTRMHEVLGVETGELFSIYEFADDELAYVDTNGNVLSAKNNIPVGPYTLTVAINHGIIRKPLLSEEVNPDSHQYVDNDSTNRRKSVKQKCRNLHSETAEICTLRCDYCGKYAKESDLTTEYTKDKYLICRRCKENA